MSCDGTAIGAPLAGDRMLFDDIISTEASICASGDSGMWTAIWSPSKSALNAVQTSGWMPDGLALDQHRLERLDAEAVQRRRAVQQNRVLADHLFEDVPHLGPLLFDHLLGLLDGRDAAAAPRACCR